jgi:hypothetical protein
MQERARGVPPPFPGQCKSGFPKQWVGTKQTRSKCVLLCESQKGPECILYCSRARQGEEAERGAHFLPSTARKLKVKLEIMAEMKPIQLKDSSAADARATPN